MAFPFLALAFLAFLGVSAVSGVSGALRFGRTFFKVIEVLPSPSPSPPFLYLSLPLSLTQKVKNYHVQQKVQELVPWQPRYFHNCFMDFKDNESLDVYLSVHAFIPGRCHTSMSHHIA